MAIKYKRRFNRAVPVWVVDVFYHDVFLVNVGLRPEILRTNL